MPISISSKLFGFLNSRESSRDWRSSMPACEGVHWDNQQSDNIALAFFEGATVF
jgi:hypothetical protein